MKGINGLIIAAVLGIIGAICNFLYIRKEAQGYEKAAFVAVRTSAQINQGDILTDEHFERVEIPRAHLGNIDQVAIPYEQLSTVIGMQATKSYEGGELLLQQDLRTLSVKDIDEMLAADEIDWAVPVDPRLFVAENYNPGDEVYFFAPSVVAAPTPVASGNGGAAATDEVVGPFRILAIGSRRESLEVSRAAGRRAASREDLLIVPLSFKNGEFDTQSEQLRLMSDKYRNPGLRVAKRSAHADSPAGGRP